MKTLVRIAVIVMAGLSAACGGIGSIESNPGGAATDAPPATAADTWCALDVSAWDASDWAE